MPNFKPISKKPGDIIKSDEWNKIQGDVRDDLEQLENTIRELKTYVNNMLETGTLTNVESPTGTSFRLDETIPGETANYGVRVVGPITKQWLSLEMTTPEICRFGIIDQIDVFLFWAGAEKGDKKCLDVTLEYVDGTTTSLGNLFIHDWSRLRPKGKDNPYTEYLLSPNERVWYKYRLQNPNPGNEVRHITFTRTNKDAVPRIGNVLQYRAKIKPLES